MTLNASIHLSSFLKKKFIMKSMRGTAVERQSLTCELSLFYARPAADG